jgi:DNA-binding CsgD family transcriptional regulator
MTLDSFQKKFHLTPRERQVGELMIAGESRKEISTTLHISIYTVAFHQLKIRRKLGTMTTLKTIPKILRLTS